MVVVFRGSVQNGFEEATMNSDFAQDVGTKAPQPGDCGF